MILLFAQLRCAERVLRILFYVLLKEVGCKKHNVLKYPVNIMQLEHEMHETLIKGNKGQGRRKWQIQTIIIRPWTNLHFIDITLQKKNHHTHTYTETKAGKYLQWYISSKITKPESISSYYKTWL